MKTYSVAKVYNITADSKPDYDSWLPDDYWSCEDWMTWFYKLVEARGKEKAKEIWLAYWIKQDSFEHNYNWCKYSSSFNTFAKKEGLDVSNIIADVGVAGQNIGSNLASGASNVSSGIESVTKVLKVLAPFIIIGVIIYFGYKFYKQAKS